VEDKDLQDDIAVQIDSINTDDLDPVDTIESDEVPSDEPVEISPEEATQTDIPTPSQPEVAAIATLVCDLCLEKNLSERCTIECMRCNELFCLHYASNVDACYCVNCMSDVSVTKQIITKTYESTGQDGEKHFYKRRARQIQIGGLDWLFAQRKIPEYSDAELDLGIEYHRARLDLLLGENEKRRVDKMHRYAGVKHVIAPTTIGTAVTSTTIVKKTKTISKNKQQEQLAALLKNLQAKGMSVDAIAAALRGK
jgi:hypothetical protein